MNGPKEGNIAGESHVEYVEKEIDKLHPGHPNGEQSEAAQCARKYLGADEDPNR